MPKEPDRNRIIIFLKDPRAPDAKTRLARGIGKRLASHLYRQMVANTVNTARKSGIHVVCYAAGPVPGAAEPGAKAQKGRDLGERMLNAFCGEFETGCRKAVIIGTDCPFLRPSDLINALTRLEKNESVLGPAVDGGYYLIGFQNKPYLSGRLKDVFTGIRWSAPDVMKNTLSRMKRLNISVSLLRKLIDIDTKRDIDPKVIDALYPVKDMLC